MAESCPACHCNVVDVSVRLAKLPFTAVVVVSESAALLQSLAVVVLAPVTTWSLSVSVAVRVPVTVLKALPRRPQAPPRAVAE